MGICKAGMSSFAWNGEYQFCCIPWLRALIFELTKNKHKRSNNERNVICLCPIFSEPNTHLRRARVILAGAVTKITLE